MPSDIMRALAERKANWQENSAKIYQALSAAFSPALRESLDRKLAAILSDNAGLKSKIRRLQTLASEAREPTATLVPCKKGCGTCCHIQIEISQAEAELIGAAIGRAPLEFAPGKHTTSSKLLSRPGTPCTFLVDDSCSIYEVRPMVCRNHIVADVDNLACGFENMALLAASDSRAVPVRLVNAGPIFTAYRQINDAKAQAWADIRQFFPPSGTPTSLPLPAAANSRS